MSTPERVATAVRAGPGQDVALDLVRTTEAAAIAAGQRPERDRPDGGTAAAVVALHAYLGSVPVRGVTVIGAGGPGRAPALHTGDGVGTGDGPDCDVGVHLGARAPAGHGPGPLVAVAVAARGALCVPTPARVQALAVDPGCADTVHIGATVAENLRAVARARGVRVRDVEVAVPDPARHPGLVAAVRGAGARIRTLQGGGVAGALAAAGPEHPVDVLMSTADPADAVVAAAAMACTGGALQVRWRSAGVEQVRLTGDLVRGDRVVFCGTGLVTSEALPGVRYHGDHAVTRSLVLCAQPRTARTVGSEHRTATTVAGRTGGTR